MIATYSAENRLRNAMTDLGVSAGFLAALVDIDPSTLSKAFRGLRPLENPIAAELLKLTSQLIVLREAVQPLQLPLMNAAKIQSLLHHLERNNVTADDVRKTIMHIFGEQS